MRKLTRAAYVLPVVCLIGAEAAFFADLQSPLRQFAGVTWMAFSVAAILTAWIAALLPFFSEYFWSCRHRVWYLLAFFLPPVLILFNAGGVRFTTVDIEGLQQLAAGMFMLRHDPSLGVFAMTYSRYMGRQFILNCLPSLVLGPSLWAARIGNSMFYIGSYCFFLSALVAYLRKKREADPLLFAGYCGILIAFGQYTLLNARKFEQTMMPIGCVLFFLAALLCFLVQQGPLRFLWLTWAFGFFTGCYTPGLAGWVLGLGVLLYLIARKREGLLILTVIYGAACLCISYLVVQRMTPGLLSAEFTIGTSGHLTAGDWLLRCLSGIRAAVGSDFTLIPAPLALAICAALCVGWRLRDYRYAAVCAWAAAVAVLSIVFLGTDFAFPNRDIQRSMIVIPPLALGAVLLFSGYLSASPEAKGAAAGAKLLMKLSMGYMVFTGIFTVLLVRSFFGTTVVDDEDEAFVLVDRLVHSSEVAPRIFYMAPPMDINLAPGLQYFAPDAKVVHGNPPAGEKIPGAYVLSYLKKYRFDDELVPSRNPRPFIRMDKE
jgi:hypothetical protein